MNPSVSARLIAIAGPLEGQVIPLASLELAVGRERTNTLAIDDPVISRRHCVLSGTNGTWRLRDLNSMNGTYVNGLPVQERELEDGDQIQVGRSLFAFSSHEQVRETVRDAVEFDQGPFHSGATMMVRVAGESPHRHTAKLLEGLPQVWRNARNLEILLKLGSIIPASRGVEALEQAIVDLVFDAVPAQRAAILLVARGTGELQAHFHLQRGGDTGAIRVPERVVSQVHNEGVAVMSNDVQEEGIDSGAGIRSIIAVPLTAFGRQLGVFYLDSSSSAFDDDHFQLLTAIAGLAASALDHALHVESIERDNQRLQAEINLRHSMVGESPPMRTVYAFIVKAAPASSTVLIRGESGTGKELVARAIHRNGPRASQPFVAINCAALAETLLESEFFGHEKGSFTGAITQRKGKLEEADGGTVFLDEIGELAPSLQAKLLRVLQEREFQRVGGNKTIRLDIRVVAATNRDLEDAVRRGIFREDLYYRLNVVSVRMPALRERTEDIPLLAQYFAQKHARQANRAVTGISEAARTALVAYEWPGNVRELENAIERAVVLGSTGSILPEDLPETIIETAASPAPPVTRFHEAVVYAKRQIVQRAIDQAGGSYTEAARMLGLHPSNLHRLLRTLGMRE
jgi:transcriptional regulator with GAF, ATPase, and Fis domain